MSDNNEIFFIDSVISGEKEIVSIGANTFTFYNDEKDQIPNYLSTDGTFSYVTNSKNDSGPIEDIRLISRGTEYATLPYVSKIDTNSGSQALLIPESNTIGSYFNNKDKRYWI